MHAVHRIQSHDNEFRSPPANLTTVHIVCAVCVPLRVPILSLHVLYFPSGEIHKKTPRICDLFPLKSNVYDGEYQ
jgi:hypothetical protein